MKVTFTMKKKNIILKLWGAAKNYMGT